MPHFKLINCLLIAASLLPMGCVAAAGEQGVTVTPSGAAAGVAVVELFTSEGCSSCPPAEALLTALADDATRNSKPVITLSFHVDYWNDLGWRDPFSDAAHTQRQQRYSQVFGLDSIYTPQMIVNGQTQFVGSDRAAAVGAINKAVATPLPATIVATSAADHDGGIRVDYSATGAGVGTIVNIAFIQRNASSQVLRGENAGKLLHESNVVRWFRSATLADDSKGTIVIPSAVIPPVTEVHADQLSVVVFLQRPSDLVVLGAAIATGR